MWTEIEKNNKWVGQKHIHLMHKESKERERMA